MWYITVIDMSLLLVKVILYSQRHDGMNHCDRLVLFITSCLWLYSITFTKRSDMSITVTYHVHPRSPKEEGGILFYLCPSVVPSVQDIFRHIFLINYRWQKSDIWSQASYRYPILWEAFFGPSRFLLPVCRLCWFLYTLNHIMPLTVQYYCHQEEWHVYHSDLSSCLWLYSITFTKRSDMSITVIHHIMPLTVQYHFHQEEWHVYHSYLSRHGW
jgi:hypothetical protein